MASNFVEFTIDWRRALTDPTYGNLETAAEELRQKVAAMACQRERELNQRVMDILTKREKRNDEPTRK